MSGTCPQFKPEQLNLPTSSALGAGAVSHVLQSTLNKPKVPIAIKALSKIQLLQQKKVESVLNEKKALIALGPHPYIGRLYGTAQSEDEIYFVMELLPHGDLLQHIRRIALERKLAFEQLHANQESASGGESEKRKTALPKDIPNDSNALRCLEYKDIQLIAAQMILGLERIFSKGFVVRDVKPENIVFDSKYRACFIDFDTIDLEGNKVKPVSNNGVAVKSLKDEDSNNSGKSDEPKQKRRVTVSEIQEMRKKTASFCGTAQYVSPEMVGEVKWSFSSDLWALGTTVYEMLYGTHMFSGKSVFEVLQKVVKGVSEKSSVKETDLTNDLFPYVRFASPHDNEESFQRLRSFIEDLVKIDPYLRLGVDRDTLAFDVEQLVGHPFFEDFDWFIVKEQVETFKTRTFILEDEDRTYNESDEVDPDPSPSLISFYNNVPRNDPGYSEYVFRATADVNPFEKFILDKVEDDESEAQDFDLDGNTHANTEEAAALETKKESKDTETYQKHKETYSSSTSSCSENMNGMNEENDDDDDLEIIDDVGMHFPENYPRPNFDL